MTILPYACIISLIGWNNLPKLAKTNKKCTVIRVGLLAFNFVIVLWYFGTSQNHNTFYLMKYLRQEKSFKSIEFITSPYETPFYTGFHKNVPVGFPICGVLEKDCPLRLYDKGRNFYYEKRMKDYEKQGYPSHIVIS